MKKNILFYGLISGLISTSLFIGLMLLGKAGHEDFDNGAIYGYSLMLIAFSLIFVATKTIRDKELGGVISFGKAFRIGLYITLIASTIYVIVWLIDFHFFIPDFAEKYGKHILDKLQASGASVAEISKKKLEMQQFSDMYNNLFFNALITYSEILPVGLLVSLISAFTMKRKKQI